jgi:hypothetical protein
MVAQAVTDLRAAGVAAINFDLLYDGLLGQSSRDIGETVTAALALAPDRIAMFGYAHMPRLLPRQRMIDEAALPDVAARFAQSVLTADLRGLNRDRIRSFRAADRQARDCRGTGASAAQHPRLHRRARRGHHRSGRLGDQPFDNDVCRTRRLQPRIRAPFWQDTDPPWALATGGGRRRATAGRFGGAFRRAADRVHVPQALVRLQIVAAQQIDRPSNRRLGWRDGGYRRASPASGSVALRQPDARGTRAGANRADGRGAAPAPRNPRHRRVAGRFRRAAREAVSALPACRRAVRGGIGRPVPEPAWSRSAGQGSCCRPARTLSAGRVRHPAR